MTILEKLENVTQARHWTDNIPTRYQYSYGIAGERFFREIKENGRLIAAECKACKITYLPPRLYCEECFEELRKWIQVSTPGKIFSYTLAHVTLGGTPLNSPEIIALIRFEGVRGGLIHKLSKTQKRQLKIGMAVKPHFKPKPQRTGSVRDIEFFEPA